MKAFYKFLIKWYLSSGSEVPDWLARKADNDQGLSEVLDEETDFNTLLSKSLRTDTTENNSELADRILANLEDSSEEGVDSVMVDGRGLFKKAVYSLGGVAAIMALTVTFWKGNQGSIDEQVEIAVAETKEESQLALITEIDMASWKNPLDQEIEYVVSDAKGALMFLANSFLPSEYVEDLGSISES
ncbi:hypothetical protein MLD52_08355 [Puniceicoccaceae bacterium K14]|nr:hypothetical protein [Puniceicoccaceae bacterium K14]